MPIIALRTAQTAMKMGYSVTIAAEGGNSTYINEAMKYGVNVIICKELKNMSMENLLWTDDFDHILVNSIPMIRMAIKLSKKREVAVWIHESPNVYECVKFWESEIREGIQRETIRIYAVSKRAREHFFQYYGIKKEIPILSLGVEDWKVNPPLSSKRFIYGVAGGIYDCKGQDIFLSAVEKLPDMVLKNSLFYLAGKKSTSKFGIDISRRASKINGCVLLGECTPQEMKDLYKVLNVVVIPSRQETVSMVAVEAMMMGKVCIVSDHTGIADYIEQGKNGFVFHSENIDELNKLMLWCYQHQEYLMGIGENARKTYELYFSMEIFTHNLQKIL